MGESPVESVYENHIIIFHSSVEQRSGVLQRKYADSNSDIN